MKVYRILKHKTLLNVTDSPYQQNNQMMDWNTNSNDAQQEHNAANTMHNQNSNQYANIGTSQPSYSNSSGTF